MGKLFDDFRELAYFLGLDLFRWQLGFLAQECFSGGAELWESVIDHLLASVEICSPHLVKLVDSVLRHSFVEVMLWLGAQVAKVMVDTSMYS